MGPGRRVDVGGMVCHGWNRANFRSALFKNDAHYQGFPALAEESLDFVDMPILAYCLMPFHQQLERVGDIMLRRISRGRILFANGGTAEEAGLRFLRATQRRGSPPV